MDQTTAQELMKKLGFEFVEEVVGSTSFIVLAKGQEERLSALIDLTAGAIDDWHRADGPVPIPLSDRKDEFQEWVEEWLVG